MPQWCQPNTTKEGQGTAWGMYPWEELFGPEGWCQAENPQRKCSCFLDGGWVERVRGWWWQGGGHHW